MINRAGKRNVYAGPVPPPQEPAGFLFYGEDLPLGGMRVHPAATADWYVFKGAFVASNPLDFKRKLQALIIRVSACRIAKIREPVVFRISEPACKRATNLLQLKVFGWQRYLPARSEDIQIPILAAEIYPAVADSRRGGNRLSKGGLK